VYKLILAEKPSVAKSIAAVLGANERKDGFFITPHERGAGNGYIVSWCAGHLLELAAPDAYGKQYGKWRFEDLPIIPDEWKYTPVNGKDVHLKKLTALLNRDDVDHVINACDAGREGENIFRHVYDYARCGKRTQRLWISSMEENAIKTGFANLKDGKGYDNLYAAASSRERADWLVGLNLTRAMSVLYGATLNTGRAQSPTLAMLVRREAEISAFVKELFYTPYIEFDSFIAFGERMADRQAADSISDVCDGRSAIVQSIERQKKNVTPPKLFDLTTLQREANRLFGFTAQQTLDYAQSLYEKALLSYPRSDSKYLTSDMHGTAATLVEWLQKDMSYQNGADFVPDIDRLIDDAKVSYHHAINLTSAVMKTDL